MYHGSHTMTRGVFGHDSKARHSIDNYIDFRSNLVINELLQKNVMRNDVKGLSKKARSIVQRSHAPKFSWLQVPPSAHVAQYAASASRIFIFWCEYSHIKNCCKSSQLLFNFWCQLQLNACCQSILIISVVLTYFKISVMYSTYGCSRYIYQIYHSLFFRSSAMPLNAGSPICRTELGCAPL